MGSTWGYTQAPKVRPLTFISGNVLTIPPASFSFPGYNLDPSYNNRLYGPWEDLDAPLSASWWWVAIKGPFTFGFDFVHAFPTPSIYRTILLTSSIQAQVKYIDDTISAGGPVAGLSLSGGTYFDPHYRDFHQFGNYGDSSAWSIQVTVNRQLMLLYALNIGIKAVKAIRFYTTMDKISGYFAPGNTVNFHGATLTGPFSALVF